MLEELELEESRFAELTHIEEQYNSLQLVNQLDDKVDIEALTEHLRQLEGIDRVKSLTINWNSSLSNLRVLRAFTNLEYLSIYGHQIKSLDGVELFSKGEFIRIHTHKNRRRDLSQLSQAEVKRMLLHVERTEDFSAVAGCKELQTIDIYHSSIEPNLLEWKDVPLESIYFKSCKFKELGNTAATERLIEINVLGCRNLERFTGDNSIIKRMIVDSCKKLDLSTLRMFENLEWLTVNSCTQAMNLTEIGGLQHAKHISFILSNVEVDLINLKEYFPTIESLHVSGMNKEYGVQLKQLNLDVTITSDSFEL
ncbi:hypothetical protein H8B09_19210 [Paenibacillus sp. PR3]|uniref:Uncharacterized protein n=1 Tax=Paenibacillus terricola TaxID=2763503 RepID=A0ABR8MY78_9BACL|nr:hypothetical protein [Paenibacillus terricola]MBD3920903.1 hypothetical protein [Paenibacillus terricola]